MDAKVRATDAALDAIEALTDVRGRVMFFQSGGCCDGSSPICLPEGELPLGPHDGTQHLVKLTKTSTGLAREDRIRVHFVPLLAGQAREL